MRKKILRTLVAMVLIGSMMTVAAFAEGATVTGNSVNLRSGPGTNYRVIASLSKGASVTVTDQSNSEWYAVSYNGTTGFVSSRYLSFGSAGTGSGSTAAANGVINAMYVRFRSGPSASSSVLAEYSTGKEVTITGTEGGWTACTIDGKAGYVSSQYVTAYGSGSNSNGGGSSSATTASQNSGSNPASAGSTGGTVFVVGSGSGGQSQGASAPAADPTPTPAPSVNASGIVVVSPNQQGDPAPSTPAPSAPAPSTPAPNTPSSGAPATTPVESKPGYINGDYVRFRTGPSESHSIIATYNQGKELTITGISGNWTACTIDGKAGYVFSQYVKEGGNSNNNSDNNNNNNNGNNNGSDEADNSGTITVVGGSSGKTSEAGYITGNNVRFRSGPSLNSKVLGELFYGNSVTITGTDGDWTAITYNGQAGYVSSQYVTKGAYKNTSTGNSELGRQIADYALQFVGYRYTWGGASPSSGFDCSGLTSYVYKQFGYDLNRVANDQARNGSHVDASDLQPGDLLCFYSGGSYIGHVGLYIGDGKFVHAANSSSGVIITELSGYYSQRGYEARRII